MKKSARKTGTVRVYKSRTVTKENREKTFSPVIENILPKYKSKIDANVTDTIFKTIDKLKKGQSFFIPKTVASVAYLRGAIKKYMEENKSYYKNVDIRISSNSLDKIPGVRVGRFN